ncbi:hypothetical protein [Bacillus licheniformis]|jgi:chromosome segregation ATPase|nr:hypothetical protein B4089_3589 [Bacillus licheniformis]OLF87280.1 hypothetical protein B4089_3750 [Bacillus licheniformis]
MTLEEYRRELDYLESLQEDYLDKLADLQDALDNGDYDTEDERDMMQEDIQFISYSLDEIKSDIAEVRESIEEAEQIGAGLSDMERQMKMNGISQSDFI